MSDFISPPAASQRAAERNNASDAKNDAAPLRAFETALLTVKASVTATPLAGPVANPVVAPPAASNARNAERSGPNTASRDGGKTVANADDGGPRPEASATTTALASGVKGGVASETSAKTTQKSKNQTSNGSENPGENSGNANLVPDARPGTALDLGSPVVGSPVEPVDDALAPTVTLSHALADGSTPDVKTALHGTLQGFANGSVPDAIKASLSRSGAPASAEITGLLDNIAVLAQDILDKGPLSDLDMANLEQLFWVSNWFDLFNQSTTYDPNNTISHSVSSAMAIPNDIFYTRALLVPLVDAERAAAPGLVNRRAVRANTEATPGADSVRNAPAP
jgi:hypothetical protein